MISRRALTVFMGCAIGKDLKTPRHYSLKALTISQNHLRLSFYVSGAVIKNELEIYTISFWLALRSQQSRL